MASPRPVEMFENTCAAWGQSKQTRRQIERSFSASKLPDDVSFKARALAHWQTLDKEISSNISDNSYQIKRDSFTQNHVVPKRLSKTNCWLVVWSHVSFTGEALWESTQTILIGTLQNVGEIAVSKILLNLALGSKAIEGVRWVRFQNDYQKLKIKLERIFSTECEHAVGLYSMDVCGFPWAYWTLPDVVDSVSPHQDSA